MQTYSYIYMYIYMCIVIYSLSAERGTGKIHIGEKDILSLISVEPEGRDHFSGKKGMLFSTDRLAVPVLAALQRLD